MLDSIGFCYFPLDANSDIKFNREASAFSIVFNLIIDHCPLALEENLYLKLIF